MTRTMKALVKAKSEPGLWMQDVPVPQIGPDDVLVKVAKTGICGTDLHIYKWDQWAQGAVPVPMTVGHEYSGTIAELGTNVTHLKVGQRVSGEGHVIGFKSRASRAGRFHLDPETKGVGVNLPGAFAEYVKIPAFNIVPLPDAVDDELAAILDPLGNAVHTALAFDLVGEDVLITGAGPIGIMSAAVAKHVGARHVVITDPNDHRLELARKTEPSVVTVNTSEDLRAVAESLGMKEGFDVGFEMSGAPAAMATLTDQLVMGGKIAMLGLPAKPFEYDFAKMVLKMITIKGIYGREMFETWHKMLAMLQSGLDIRPVITNRFAARDFDTAFKSAIQGGAGKIVLEW
ncbi:L-threonine 3-dehydrogenase [Pelagibacterium lentulum]|uniref:L-threonine 3-dehydrogenase n=1 Tax=Pelagibacterium lentulum TaxID=2029865 RepID=A0A916RH82_9HYPH|nr:L-threonine 3-dehydrogenase [Pelagibacterium lentulum]GGA55710.1 L-threonine 3-dehydrogenase [Pelagibacterium lentulum]